MIEIKGLGPSIPERGSLPKTQIDSVIIIKTDKVLKVSVDKGMSDGLQ